MTLDRNRPVQVRDGMPVRIITWTEGTEIYPVVGEIEGVTGVQCWTPEGKFYSEGVSGHDLVNVPERRVTWSRIWRRGPSSQTYSSPDEALATVSRKSNLVGLLKITWEDDKPVSVELEEV